MSGETTCITTKPINDSSTSQKAAKESSLDGSKSVEFLVLSTHVHRKNREKSIQRTEASI